MCLRALWTWIQDTFRQFTARFSYRVDKYRAKRARKRFLRRELKGTITNCNYNHQSNFSQYNQYSQVGHNSRPPYMPTTYIEDDSDDEDVGYCRDVEQGVGVLSPQRLSQRLNENALAREAVGESDAELAQYLKDERIALFLQNDEFMDELRTNREFMTALQEDYESEAGDDDDAEGAKGKGQIANLDDATLRERIATMGKASRKKFAQIAKVFSRRKRSSGRGLLPSTGGRDQLLISGDPLIDEDDEERQAQAKEGSVVGGGLSSSPRHLR
ncbi:Cuedc1p [Halocaridina rubra]|uniref:Cuedc1p n=1 Tax=Halocaridina rubra TaxID=373956 RepID=A0AAN8X0R6_HALRR